LQKNFGLIGVRVDGDIKSIVSG